MSEISLQHIYSEGSPLSPVLLLLHGTGGGPSDLIGLGEAISPGSAVLAPAGPVTENGATRWFRRYAEGVFDYDDVADRAKQLADFVDAASNHYEISGRRLVAIGFSNGANIAAALTLLYPQVLSTAILFSAMMPLATPVTDDLSATNVFLSNGKDDPLAPSDSVNKLVANLQNCGAKVQVHRHALGHRIHPEGVIAAKTWLANGAT